MADAHLIRCSTCGSINRVPVKKIRQGLQPVCGRCKTPLATADNKPVTITDATFSAEVERSPVPVLLDMWAPWCGHCQMVAPVVEELAKEMAGRVRVAKLNVDENPATATRFGVRSVPTLLLLKAGKELDRIVGVQPKSAILQRLERIAA
jgi:thioredoxin 2